MSRDTALPTVSSCPWWLATWSTIRGEPPEMGGSDVQERGLPLGKLHAQGAGSPVLGPGIGAWGILPTPRDRGPPGPLCLGVGIMAPAGLHPSGQRCWGTGLWPCMPHLGRLEAPSHTGATRLRQGRGTLNARRRLSASSLWGAQDAPGDLRTALSHQPSGPRSFPEAALTVSGPPEPTSRCACLPRPGAVRSVSAPALAGRPESGAALPKGARCRGGLPDPTCARLRPPPC